MKKVKSKLFSVLLAVVLLVGMIPATAFATEVEQPEVQSANIDTSKPATLTIKKYSVGQGDTSKPLAGVTFTYLKVADIEQITVDKELSTVAYKIMNDAFSDKLQLPAADYTVGSENYYKASTIQKQLTAHATEMKDFILSQKGLNDDSAKDMDETKADGQTKKDGLKLGLYLVVETAYPAMVTTVTPPFIVSLPMPNGTDQDGDSTKDKESTYWNYNVVASPKNEIGDQPEIDKNIVKGEQLTKVDDVKIGDTVTYQIDVEIPKNIDQLKYFCVKDIPSKGLTFDKITDVKAVGSTTKPLVENTNYQVSKSDKEVNIAFMRKSELVGFSKLQITLTATVNDQAVVKKEGNPNTASLVYSNKTSTSFDDTKVEPDTNVDTVAAKEPVVFTYGMDVTKVNDENKKLPGAEFQLQNSKEEKIKDFVSDDNGEVKYSGLDTGTYYLVETKAPAGYNLLKDKIKLEITSSIAFKEDTDGTGSYIKIENDATYHTRKDGKWATLEYKPEQLVTYDGAKYLNVGNKKVYSAEDPTKGVSLYKQTLTWNETTYKMDDEGYVRFNVVNNKGIELPKTGGAGTLAFTLGGLALISVAGIYFVGMKKKKVTK